MPQLEEPGHQEEQNKNAAAQPGAAAQPKAGFSELGSFIFDLIKIFLISCAIILPVRYYVAQPFIVSGSSMEPNFYSGEYLVINELSYHFEKPQRGDIIVFKYPKDNSEYFIKRIIGLPGEQVRISDNHVIIINKQYPKGLLLDESYLPNSAQTLSVGNNTSAVLGADEYFVLGDNRLASSDSRFWGPVPSKDIIGKVFIRAFPFQTIKKFDTVQYTGQ